MASSAGGGKMGIIDRDAREAIRQTLKGATEYAERAPLPEQTTVEGGSIVCLQHGGTSESDEGGPTLFTLCAVFVAESQEAIQAILKQFPPPRWEAKE
jgi:hypothetical protein